MQNDYTQVDSDNSQSVTSILARIMQDANKEAKKDLRLAAIQALSQSEPEQDDCMETDIMPSASDSNKQPNKQSITPEPSKLFTFTTILNGLIADLAHHDAKVRKNSADTLAWLNEKAATPVVIEALQKNLAREDNVGVRQSIENALKSLSAKNTTPTLRY